MKKLFFGILLFFFWANTFGQNVKSAKDFGIPTYVNFCATAYWEYTKVGNSGAFTFGGGATMVFNNNLFLGGYFKTKMNGTTVPAELPMAKGRTDLDLSYNELGGWLGGKIGLGAYRTQSGRYTPRLITLTYGLQGGIGRIYLDDGSDLAVDNDYFIVFRPQIGIERPITRNIIVGFGGHYTLPFRINRYYQNSDFSGVGGFLQLKFRLFARKVGSVYLRQ